MRIFIADDEPQQRSGMQHLIKSKYQDFDVLTFKNGAECLEEYMKQPADIVFSDIRMPHMSGLDLTEKMRKINPSLIVILISAYTEFEYARKGIDLGVFSYLLKPINPSDVFQIMEKAIGHYESSIMQHVATKEESQDINLASSEEAIEFAVQYVHQNYMKHISLQDIANKCHYSVSHFSMRFKTQTGMSFITYLNEYRLEKAFDLLVTTQKGLSEIASSVGFDDTKYFSRLFIRKYGKSPNRYRKNL